MVYDSEALPAKTDNNVKNYWNTKLRKKLVKMGIDPVSHKSIPNASRLPTSGSKNFYLNFGSMDLSSRGPRNARWQSQQKELRQPKERRRGDIIVGLQL
ncbi:hypothetical protein SAY87_022284 [Trapa incisa]|uniref:HTH myb-type domain-containing protein n=1 Tax=Trapa incisa TaxID=236973 RepID=A0AAN7Q4F4_9MYRT|nr:hypothetical protein SAY87_022284 [Trapa incisa]